jgi:hypothetical protein
VNGQVERGEKGVQFLAGQVGESREQRKIPAFGKSRKQARGINPGNDGID